MKLNIFMSIAAVVACLFGLAFLLAPVLTMSMYGVALDISGQSIAKYLGSAYLGIAVMIWLARNAQPNNEALRAITMGGLILCLTSLIVSLLDVFKGGGNNLIWSTVIIHFLLAVGFGYYRFGKSAGS